MKRQATDQEKIIPNHICDKGLNSRKYREFSKLNNETNNPIKKWARYFNRHMTKSDIKLASKKLKRCSKSLTIREMKIKATMKYYYTPIRMSKVEKTKTNRIISSVRERGQQLKLFYTGDGNGGWHSHFRKKCGSFLKS